MQWNRSPHGHLKNYPLVSANKQVFGSPPAFAFRDISSNIEAQVTLSIICGTDGRLYEVFMLVLLWLNPVDPQIWLSFGLSFSCFQLIYLYPSIPKSMVSHFICVLQWELWFTSGGTIVTVVVMWKKVGY